MGLATDAHWLREDLLAYLATVLVFILLLRILCCIAVPHVQGCDETEKMPGNPSSSLDAQKAENPHAR